MKQVLTGGDLSRDVKLTQRLLSYFNILGWVPHTKYAWWNIFVWFTRQGKMSVVRSKQWIIHISSNAKFGQEVPELNFSICCGRNVMPSIMLHVWTQTWTEPWLSTSMITGSGNKEANCLLSSGNTNASPFPNKCIVGGKLWFSRLKSVI